MATALKRCVIRPRPAVSRAALLPLRRRLLEISFSSNTPSSIAPSRGFATGEHERNSTTTSKRILLGVTKEEGQMKKWRAKLKLENGTEVDGGLHWTEEDAARAYDKLVLMLVGPAAPRNFNDYDNLPVPSRRSSTKKNDTTKKDAMWQPPSKTRKNWIEVKMRVPLTAEEVVYALEKENGQDIFVLDLTGRSNLADAMIFVTGNSHLHLMRMADMLVDALKARRIRPVGMNPGVEGRDCDDWMIVDCGNLVVQIFNARKRKALNLEEHWSKMRDGVDLCEGMTHDEFLDAYPLPDDGDYEGIELTEEDLLALDEDEDWTSDVKESSSPSHSAPRPAALVSREQKEKPKTSQGRR